MQGLVLTSSTPSASTTRDQVLGLSTNGSPKLFWGTVTKAGSVLGAKTICLVCSVPGVGGTRGCEGTGGGDRKPGAANQRLRPGERLCNAAGSPGLLLVWCCCSRGTTIPHQPVTEASTLNLLSSLMGEKKKNLCNP